MWDGHFGHIHVSKQRIDVLNDEVGPAHSVPCQAGPTERQFATAEIILKIAEYVIETATTRWAASIVFAPKKDCCFAFASTIGS